MISLLSRNNRFTLPSPLKAFGSIQLMEFLDKYLFKMSFKIEQTMRMSFENIFQSNQLTRNARVSDGGKRRWQLS